MIFGTILALKREFICQVIIFILTFNRERFIFNLVKYLNIKYLTKPNKIIITRHFLKRRHNVQNDEILFMIKEFTNTFQDFNNRTLKFIDDQLNKTGLVRTHFEILNALAGGKDLSMSDLSEILHVTKPNITVLIDKLVKQGYVERVSRGNDRRVILVRLTDEGEKFVRKSSEELIQSSAQLLDYLDEEDLELIKETTQAMKKLLLKFDK